MAAKKVSAKGKPKNVVDDAEKWLKKQLGVKGKYGSGAYSQSMSGVSKAGHAQAKGAAETAKFIAGDPKKGWQDVAYNTGTWLIPYGKGAKVIEKGVNVAIKGAKTGRVIKGVAKTVGAVSAPSVLESALNKTRKTSKPAKKTSAKKTTVKKSVVKKSTKPRKVK